MSKHRPISAIVALIALVSGPAPVGAVAPGAPTGVHVVARTETAALIRWTPGAGATRGFKIRPSDTPGVHPDPVGFPGGRAAAFTWTTDDGYDDNLLYAPTFDSRGLHYTAFLNPVLVGTPGYLTWNDIRALHLDGHEMANHTYTHKALVDDRALAIRYIGAGPCSLAVVNGALRTWVSGTLDLDVVLTAGPVAYLSTLVPALDADPDYEVSLLYAADTIFATRSQWLDPVAGLQIGLGGAPETLTTARGVHDDTELLAEVLGAQAALEGEILPIDATYRCRTLAYPNHGHSQWSMSKLNELGYLGARSGPPGNLPFYSQGAYEIGFTTTYEVPHSFPRSSNAWTEAQTRAQFAARMTAWKANHEWAVLMSHHEAEVDAQHLEWTIDQIASDPGIWIARFDEVMDYLSAFAVDVGLPIDPSSGTGSGWIHGLAPGDTKHVVVTAYNAALEESGWSMEVVVPPFGTPVDSPARPGAIAPMVRFMPNPFRDATAIEFFAPASGPARVDIRDLAGRRVREMDLGWVAAGPVRLTWDGRGEARQPVASGIYWFRVESAGRVQTGRVTRLR